MKKGKRVIDAGKKKMAKEKDKGKRFNSLDVVREDVPLPPVIRPEKKKLFGTNKKPVTSNNNDDELDIIFKENPADDSSDNKKQDYQIKTRSATHASISNNNNNNNTKSIIIPGEKRPLSVAESKLCPPAKKSPPIKTRGVSSLNTFGGKPKPVVVVDIKNPSTQGKSSSLMKKSPPMKEKMEPEQQQHQQQKIAGLINFGNSCYINSVLQALFHTDFKKAIMSPDLIKAMKSADKRKDDYEPRVFNAINCVFAEMVRQSDQPTSAELLKDAVSFYDSRFSSRSQKDAHEFLTYLLGCLDDEIEPCIKESSNPVHECFGCSIVHNVVCKECKETSSVDESFFCLSLGIPNDHDSIKLSDMLRLFFCPKEVIEHKCERCGNMVATQNYAIKKLPKYLIFHLKRFEILKDTIGTSRLSYRKVTVPLVEENSIDLKDFIYKKDHKKPKGGSVYAINAIVCHRGDAVSFGHYVTYVYDKLSNRWSLYNDSVVARLCVGNLPDDKSKYILFYERVE